MKNALNKMHDFNCLHSDGCLRIERKEFLRTAIAKHLCFANSTHTLIAYHSKDNDNSKYTLSHLDDCVRTCGKSFSIIWWIGFARDLCDNTDTYTRNHSRSNREQMAMCMWMICLCAHIDATKSLFTKKN